MAKSNTFQCSVVTPEKTVLDCEVTSVVFPAHDGELGVLLNRAPLVCKLGIGRLRADSPDEKHTMFIDGGFAQIVGNRLTILTEQACRPDEINIEKAGQSLTEAHAMRIPDDAAYTARDNAIQRAKVQIKIGKTTI